MVANESIIDQIKEKNLIEDIVEECGYPLQQRGRWRRCTRAGASGLVVDVQKQVYHRYATGEWGDVIAFYQVEKRLDFKAAAIELARRAHLPEPMWDSQSHELRLAARAKEECLDVAQRVFRRWLAKSEAALAYVERRGWALWLDEVDADDNKKPGAATLAMLGYSGDGTNVEREEMRQALLMAGVDLECPTAVAVLGWRGDVVSWARSHNIPGDKISDEWVVGGYVPGMIGQQRLVYPHVYNGRIVYLSARAIGEKRHYNVPEALLGKRQAYFNYVYTVGAKEVVIVEGQADAISLAQAELPAIALAGVSVADGLTELLKRHKTVYLGLDADAPGVNAAWQVAEQLGAEVRLLPMVNPAGVHFAVRENANQRERELTEQANGICEALGKTIKWPLDDGLARWGEGAEARQVKDANDLVLAMMAAGADVREEMRKALGASVMYVEALCTWAGMRQGAARAEAMERALRVVNGLGDMAFSLMRSQLAKALGVTVRELAAMMKAAAAEKATAAAAGEPIYTWGEYVDGWLLEYLYDQGKHEAMLAWRDPGGKIGSGTSVEINGRRYEPAEPDENIHIGTVLFPSKLGDAKPLRELVAYVEMFVKSVYLLPSDKMARLIAYFVMSTWVYDAFSSLIYLRLMGDAGAGKSELMFRIGLVTYRPISANGADSTSSLFRMVQQYKGTVLIDEADLEKSDTAQDMIKFYNLGAFKGRPILRSIKVVGPDGNDNYEVRGFRTFCPKILTLRKEFRDDAVGSRSLTIKLQPRETNELVAAGIPLQITNAINERAQALRNLLLRWRLETWQPEIEIDPSVYDLQISARLNQVAGSLLALASDDSEQQEEIRVNLREYYRETILSRSMTLTARVIEAIWKIWKYPDLHNQCVKNDGEGALIKIGDITRITNELIDEMNDTDEEDEGDSPQSQKNQKSVKAQRVGYILREELQFQVTERRRDGFFMIWNEPRLRGVSMRFGVNPDQIGPLPEPVKPQQGKML